MSSPLPMHPPLATLDDDAWEDLLNFIEERRVIPIIGPELLQVETDAGPRLLYEWVAEKLAVKLGVDTSRAAAAVHAERRRLLVPRRRAAGARRRTRDCAASSATRTSRRRWRLRQLAQITDFDLFVTTTFDPLLEQAVNLERFGGAQSTEVIAYAPNRVADLPAEREKLHAPGHLPPARAAVGVADLRHLRRGHARVHLRAAKRAPDAREALPRARAQSPAVHRQQLHQLARAPVPADGQAPPPVRSARRRRSARRQPFRQRRAADELPAAGERAHARLQRRRQVRRRAASALDDAPASPAR